jgi:hypothetical protein
MSVIVYFESKNYAYKVAEFTNEQTYIRCLPSLEKLAKDQGMIVTESIQEVE